MEKPTIMVIDDDISVATSITNVINDTEKYQVITAYSAKEALEYLAKNKLMMGLKGNRIRLIILDIKMPDMDGLEFLARLRKDYGEEKIGVTMLTAFEDGDKWEQATDGFVVNYLRKPLVRKQLIETIDNFFEGKSVEMTLKTFEKHIEKRDELKKKGESEAKK